MFLNPLLNGGELAAQKPCLHCLSLGSVLRGLRDAFTAGGQRGSDKGAPVFPFQENPLLVNRQEASQGWEAGFVCLFICSLFCFTIFITNIQTTSLDLPPGCAMRPQPLFPYRPFFGFCFQFALLLPRASLILRGLPWLGTMWVVVPALSWVLLQSSSIPSPACPQSLPLP